MKFVREQFLLLVLHLHSPYAKAEEHLQLIRKF
jgi:hypothetical protein